MEGKIILMSEKIVVPALTRVKGLSGGAIELSYWTNVEGKNKMLCRKMINKLYWEKLYFLNMIILH